MYIYTSTQIKEVDRQAEQKGMSLFTLMENAGSGLYRILESFICKKDHIVILAGRGNNGGDGIVLARYLRNNGFSVSLTFPLGLPKTKIAIEHFNYYQSCNYPIEEFTGNLLRADWIIDALLGVGSRLPLGEEVVKITEWINHQHAKVVAIDLPTGVASDTGDIDEHTVQAQYTFALHGFKPSTFLFPAAQYFGQTKVVDIGLPHSSQWKVWNKQDVKKTLPKNIGNTHKGTFGTGLLVAGSDEMPGSAALAAIGALRFGTGKLSISTTKHASTIIGPLAPEATFVYDLQTLHTENQYSCIAIGPGLTPNTELEKLIQDLLEKPIPIVLDAGALSKRIYPKRLFTTVITPHPGEFRRLTGKSSDEIQKNRLSLASAFARENGITVVLKGKYTVIAFSDGSGYINPTGNRALSKGGTGDTLTGMLLASINIHKDEKEAIANAVYLHSACADEWIKENGAQTMSAHDFNHLLPAICYRFK